MEKKEDIKKSAEEKKKKRKRAPSALWVRYYLTLVIFTIVVLLVVGWFLALQPQYDNYKNLNLDAKKAELAEYESTLAKLEKTIADWNAVPAQDKAKLDYFLPTDKDIPELITMLEDIAGQSGFIATKVSLSNVETPAVAGTDVYPMLVSMSLSGGNYTALKTFLEKVETNIRLMDVSSLSFQAGKGTYNLNIMVYYIKTNKE